MNKTRPNMHPQTSLFLIAAYKSIAKIQNIKKMGLSLFMLSFVNALASVNWQNCFSCFDFRPFVVAPFVPQT
jgi:hypothetical protein